MTEKKRRLSKKKRAKLVLDHLYLVKLVVNKIIPQIPNRVIIARHVDYDDLHSAALIGLVNASKKYGPTKGCLFSTFSRHYIRGALLDELRSHDSLTRVLRDKHRKLEKILEKLEHKLGRQPTDEEIAIELDMDMEAYHMLAKELTLLPMYSLEDHWEDGNGNMVCVGDLMTDSLAHTPQDKVIQNQLIQNIINIIQQLPEIYQVYFLLHYVENFTLKEIGNLFGFHESRISQIISETTATLKEHINNINI